MKTVLLLTAYAIFNASISFALGGGGQASPEAAKANAAMPFIMLGVLVLIAVLDHYNKK